MGVVAPGRHLDRLGDRDPERAGAVRVRGQDLAAGLGLIGRRGDAAGAVALHQRPAIGLLLEADPDHVDVDLEPEQAAGQRQRRAPLAGAGLGRDPGDARLLVVVRLGHRGVRLVAAGRAHALVFVVDPGRGIEEALEPARPVERRRPPQAIDVADRIRDLDRALLAHLLEDQRHREQGCELRGADRLQRPRMQGRRRRPRQIGREIVPVGRNPLFAQDRLQGPLVGRHDAPPAGRRRAAETTGGRRACASAPRRDSFTPADGVTI